MGNVSWSMNQNMLSLLTDCRGLKHLKIEVANRPSRPAKQAVTNSEANCSPPWRAVLSDKAGVLEFLPAAKIESKIPPSTQIMIASIEYPFNRMNGKYFYII